MDGKDKRSLILYSVIVILAFIGFFAGKSFIAESFYKMKDRPGLVDPEISPPPTQRLEIERGDATESRAQVYVNYEPADCAMRITVDKTCTLLDTPYNQGAQVCEVGPFTVVECLGQCSAAGIKWVNVRVTGFSGSDVGWLLKEDTLEYTDAVRGLAKGPVSVAGYDGVWRISSATGDSAVVFDGTRSMTVPVSDISTPEP